MKIQYIIRKAECADVNALTALAHRSKQYWNYPQAWIKSWKEQLTVTPEMIQNWVCYVAEHNGLIKGFWCRSPIQSDTHSPGLSFVEPDAIGTGCGKQIWVAIKAGLINRGVDYFVIEADPNAVQFYLKLCAKFQIVICLFYDLN